MKRLVGLLLYTVLVFSLFVFPSTVQAVDTKDQFCNAGNDTAYENISDNTPNEQGFRPTQNRLSSISLRVGGINMTGGTPLKVSIFDDSGNVLGETVTLPTISSATLRQWTFSEPITLTPEGRYRIRLEKSSGVGTAYWYTNSDCYSRGVAYQSSSTMGFDFVFETYGYNYTPPAPEVPAVPATPSTPVSTTTSTVTTASGAVVATNNKALVTAPVVAASVLAVPINFKVDLNQDEQIVFSWDKNKEADLAGYVLYIYEAKKDTETEIIDIPDKELDNYNLALADHPALSKDKEYDVKLAAKNAAGAVSEKTLSLRVKFAPKAEVKVEAVKGSKLMDLFLHPSTPFILGALVGILLVILIVLESKHHGLRNLFKKSKTE